MNIYTLIEEGQEFEHLLNEKTLFKLKKVKGLAYNPLTYAIKVGNGEALDRLIEFISHHEKKVELTEKLLNSGSIYAVANELEENDGFMKPILQHLPVSREAQYYFMDIALDRFENTNKGIEEFLKLIPPQKCETYEEVTQLERRVRRFNSRHQYYMATSFDFYANKLKEFVTEFPSYHKFCVLYEMDDDREELRRVVQAVDNLVLKASSKQEFMELFAHKIPDFVNEQYKQSKHRDIFHANNRYTQHLKEDISFNKLQFYVKLAKDFQAQQDIEKLLKDSFAYHYVQDRKSVNTQELEALLREKRFKSITIDKDADIHKVVEILKEGTALVQEIYGMDADDVGGTKLSLLFTFEDCPQGGAAGLLPGGNLITYRLKLLDDLGKRHFVHEFSHYLQDKKYHLSNMTYNESGKHVLDDNELWQGIDKALSTARSTMEDVLEYGRSIIDHYIPGLKEEHKEKILLVVQENIDKEPYKRQIESCFKSLFTHSHKYWDGMVYEINGREIDESNLNHLLGDFERLQRAHQSPSFLKQLWTDLDERRGGPYFSNQMEIHSRLTESLTGIKAQGEYFLQYPTQGLMKEIKPKLEKFNQMLAAYYTDYIVPYKPKKFKWDSSYTKEQDDSHLADEEWEKLFEQRMKRLESNYGYNDKDKAVSSVLKLRAQNLNESENPEPSKAKKK